MAGPSTTKRVQLAYIGCWYKNDMCSHNCSNLVDSLQATGTDVNVITSNCRCFSSALKFTIAKDELINEKCSTIAIPYAPRNPSMKHGRLKYLAVKTLRIDLILATVRGILYYKRARKMDVIHFDQVLEAFGFVPFFILVTLGHWFGKRVIVAVHEIDPFQKQHPWFNRCYSKCAEIFVYSADMKKKIIAIGAPAGKIKIIRYGTTVPELMELPREQYVFFGGHSILRGKGYPELLSALAQLKARGVRIRLLIYFGHGCNGLQEAKSMAAQMQLDDVITWQEFLTREELPTLYQRSKACIIPFTDGSARHPLTCAMVKATPVIATRAVDIPEYLGELGIYIEGNAASLAKVISDIENGRVRLDDLGERLRAKALQELDDHKIAAELSTEYSRIGTKSELLQIHPSALG